MGASPENCSLERARVRRICRSYGVGSWLRRRMKMPMHEKTKTAARTTMSAMKPPYEPPISGRLASALSYFARLM